MQVINGYKWNMCHEGWGKILCNKCLSDAMLYNKTVILVVKNFFIQTVDSYLLM